MSGGQWPQVREAAVPAFKIDDRSCQLCFQENGTLEHRHVCPATSHACCITPPPPKTDALYSKLSADRKRILRTRGLLFVKAPIPPPRNHAHFEWHRPPPWDNPALADATWYCDGSLLHGSIKPCRATGFGIAVVSADGVLLAFGSGRPPARCKTAAAAEAWALFIVLDENAFMPHVRTDCQSLLSAAMAGSAIAGGQIRFWERSGGT
jgi:hypothetical protein